MRRGARGADDEPTGTVSDSLGVRITGVTSSDTSWYNIQAETAVDVSIFLDQTTVATVAFNDTTNASLSTNCSSANAKLQFCQNAPFRRIRKGASLMGWATSSNQGSSWSFHSANQFGLPPSNWSVLWGDPAIAVAPGGTATTANHAYLTQIAVPMAKMGGKHAPTDHIDGQITDGDFLGGGCIARSLDRGVTFTTSNTDCFCHTTGTPDCAAPAEPFDGGAITVTANGYVYAAWVAWPYPQSSNTHIDVYRASSLDGNFTRLSNDPFPGRHPGHPKLATWNNTVYLLSNDETNHIVITKQTPPDTTWATAQVSSFTTLSNVDSSVTLGNNYKIRNANNAEFGIGNPTTLGGDDIRIVYQTYFANKWMLGTWICDLNLNCNDAGVGWSTFWVAGDQFMPTMAAFGGVPAWGLPPVFEAVYWSREYDPTGNIVVLTRGRLDVSGGSRVWVQGTVVASQIPCPTNPSGGGPGYWGDYIGAKYLDYPSGPRFITGFMDSTWGCDERWGYHARHTHISGTTFQ
jgi:hypothetical protein